MQVTFAVSKNYPDADRDYRQALAGLQLALEGCNARRKAGVRLSREEAVSNYRRDKATELQNLGPAAALSEENDRIIERQIRVRLEDSTSQATMRSVAVINPL